MRCALNRNPLTHLAILVLHPRSAWQAIWWFISLWVTIALLFILMVKTTGPYNGDANYAGLIIWFSLFVEFVLSLFLMVLLVLMALAKKDTGLVSNWCTTAWVLFVGWMVYMYVNLL